MKIEIIKMKRKTICLKLESADHAVLKVPKTTSQKKIDEFLEGKRAWLEKNAKKLRERENFGKEFDFLRFIYFDGKPYVETATISMDFDNLAETKKKSLIKKFYLSHFSTLQGLAQEISAKTGLKYKEIRPTSSVRVWGSFSAQKVMKLNWKLLILPRDLTEYVICHELCHSLHMNHQPKFWKAVEKICPDFKARKKELSKFAFVLKNGL